MITITAVIRARAGREAALRDALAEIARHAAREEPGTFGFFVSQGIEDRAVFTTYERFADEAAKDAHKGSDAVARFLAQAGGLIEGDAILHTCAELSAAARAP
jgi:quinol monooxygenase YgiN